MFVPRFHNTFLLKLGILGLIINLTLLPFDAIASDSDSQISSPDSEIDTAEVSIEETPEEQNEYPNNVPLEKTSEEQNAKGVYEPQEKDNGVTYCGRVIPDYGDPRFNDFHYYSDGTCGPDGPQCPRCEKDYPPKNKDHIKNPYSIENCDFAKLCEIYNAFGTSNQNDNKSGGNESVDNESVDNESNDNESYDDEYDPY